ncbi:MAG: hypothetical protein ACR2PM_16395 [Hyphomicrobiales bacterium]
MTRTLMALTLLLAVLSACSTAERDAPADADADLSCVKKPSGDDETDGGVGGTGKTPQDCEDERRSE